MKQVMEFAVLVTVNEDGLPDDGPIRDAITRGLEIANGEGYLTALDNETTEVVGWVVRHRATLPFDPALDAGLVASVSPRERVIEGALRAAFDELAAINTDQSLIDQIDRALQQFRHA